MTTPAAPLLPTDVLVAAAWLATIPGFTAAMTGELLPPDVDPVTGEPAAWLQTGFLTVQPAGGAPDVYLPKTETVVQVDVWAAVPGSNSPPWHFAEALAQAVTVATWQRVGFNRRLTPQVEGVEYPPAMVTAAYMAGSWKRLYDDAADYARISGNLGLVWIMPSLTTS